MLSAVVPLSISVGEGRLCDSGFLHSDHQERQLVEQIERDEDDCHRERIAAGGDDGSKDKQDNYSDCLPRLRVSTLRTPTVASNFTTRGSRKMMPIAEMSVKKLLI